MSNPSPIGINSLSYSDTVWGLLVPPPYRLTKWLAWGSALTAALQWFNDVLFGSYLLGAVPDTPYFDNTLGYSQGDRVVFGINGGGIYYGDNAVYEALTTVPSGIQPNGTNVVPGTAPAWVVDSVSAVDWLTTGNNSNPFYWVKVQQNFIGAAERANYSCQKIIYEYALNKWFNTTFRQPVSGTSDIYIETNTVDDNGFYFYSTNYESYFLPVTVRTTISRTMSKYFYPPAAFTPQYDFSIFIPVADYNALNSDFPVSAGYNTANRDSLVRGFADLLCPAGAFYSIITY